MPDFVIIGAAKAGTTSLYRLLQHHPDIFMPEVKEPEFFARDEHYAAGIQKYGALFADAGPDQLAGEGSTIYSLSPFFPQTAARLASHAPRAKLIYVMRQPVERAYSFYVQILKNYQNVTRDLRVHRSFEEFIDPDRGRSAVPREKVFSKFNAHLPDDPELCLAGSDYIAQIAAWRAHFPAEQFLFLKFEDFVMDRSATLRQITDFLGLAPLPPEIFLTKGAPQNVAANHFKRHGQQRIIQRLRNRLGRLWALRLLLPAGLRNALRQKLLSKIPDDKLHLPPKMKTATRDRLTKRFKAQSDQLEREVGLDLSDWWS